MEDRFFCIHESIFNSETTSFMSMKSDTSREPRTYRLVFILSSEKILIKKNCTICLVFLIRVWNDKIRRGHINASFLDVVTSTLINPPLVLVSEKFHILANRDKITTSSWILQCKKIFLLSKSSKFSLRKS